MLKRITCAFLRVAIIVAIPASLIFAQTQIPEPKDVLGFTPGEDYKLAHWNTIVAYFKKLDASSDRVIFKEIGKTTMGKPFTYAIISSPENLKRLDYYRGINDQLADPRKISRSDNVAKKLIRQGKTFVVITHGIHSTEVGSTLSSTLIAHRLASSNAPDIKKILKETIIVMVPSLNPDGVDIVKDWYDKTLGTKFEGTSPPELYHKYVGHDNNRDWYAFTQVETQMTVEKIHNVYHPQIVHDIHQQGDKAARFFVPPYEPPVEPNVPVEIIEGYTELGHYIARQMRKNGFEGITNNTTYDAWTPARAYSHYHGGVRILSETASAKLATPTEIKFEDLRGRRGFDAKKESENFGPVWKGGKWGLGDITNYMTTGAFLLLEHAARDRKDWLERFYKIGKHATRPRKNGELWGYVLPFNSNRGTSETKNKLLTVLSRGGVEYSQVPSFQLNGKTYDDYSVVISLAQPYGYFAKTLIEKQKYPDLIDEKGDPIPPYDVTAHNLALLMDVEIAESFEPLQTEWDQGSGSGPSSGCSQPAVQGIYRSYVPSMDEGWTRWIFDDQKQLVAECMEYKSVTNREILSGDLIGTESIIFPDQSPNQILKGYKDDSMPKEYTGGIGKQGVEKLREYVENGGTLVFLNRSSDFAIKQFNLPVKNVAENWKQKNFYIPGSILRTELNTSHPIATGLQKQSIAWFERSPVFEIKSDPNVSGRVKMIARYPKSSGGILLSGWALGVDKIAGKGALVEVKLGKGRIVMFGFRPQYRGQSLATFPLLINSLRQ